MQPSVRVVHVVAKTHLDLGFTALAAEVEQRYLTDFFPRALAVAEELRGLGGPERLTWTTGSWILHRALEDGDASRAEAVAAGVQAGDLAWHALPLTFHTELMDVPLVRSGLAISAELDARFGRRTTAAKMTDVPGHARGLVPLLAEAGVSFLHLGVNPAWPLPDVPPAFRWRAPGGTEVVVAYQEGGYGGEVVVHGCDEALAFLHAGDNLGPPSAEEVLAAHAALRARHPGAEVRASTLDAFARALAASGAVDALPVVTQEIGDPWLFGVGSDPAKVGAYRELLRRRRAIVGHESVLQEVDRTLLLVAEHTWGLDQKEVLPVEPPWDDAALVELRATPAGRRFEASWAEQRAYVERAAGLLRSIDPGARSIADRAADAAAPPLDAEGCPTGFVALAPDGALPEGLADAFADAFADAPGWQLAVDPATGALRRAVHLASGRALADDAHPLGLVAHQTFAEAEYERFYAQLQPAPEDEWWARRDNAKPGIDAAGARSGTRTADAVDAWARALPGGGVEVVVRLRFAPVGDDGSRVGAPSDVWASWSVRGDRPDVLHGHVRWTERAASRLPHALWCSFVPWVDEPERWALDKLGERVSPLDVVARGGRSLHAVGEGLHHVGPDGTLVLRTLDAPLVAPGRPNLLDADPPVPDLAGGFHVLLHDTCWGTNFPMWDEGPASFRFELELGPPPHA